MDNYLEICVHPTISIKEAMEVIGRGRVQIALVVDFDGRLLGTLSDGDVRRSILKGKGLEGDIEDSYNTTPIYIDNEKSQNELLYFCSKNNINQLPVVGKNNKVVDLFIVNEISLKHHKNIVVLMVGGLGTRLRPLTENTPKPMLKVGGKPILETIIEGFVKSGFDNFVMCVGYKADVIRNHFKDGSEFGVSIEYVTESKRMGTAGALTLIKKKPKEAFFVMNGDLLTKASYENFLEFHKSNKAMATMCVREYEIEVPYGVVNMKNENITSIEEKPVHSFFVNSGIYLLEPGCIDLIPNNKYYDMPSLFEKIISLEEKVVSFPLREYWMDIGRMPEYKQANQEYTSTFE